MEALGSSGRLWDALGSFGGALGGSGTWLLPKKMLFFEKNDPPEAKYTPQTRAFTKKDVIFEKNDPPEARHTPKTRAFCQ